MTLKLGYWPVGGIAQPIRMLLHILGEDYENVIFNNREEWAPVKQQRTGDGDDFVNIPYLQDGDVFITESGAIPYYLCQKFNKDLYGKNALDTTRVLQINGVINDFHKAIISPIFYSKEPKETAAKAIKEGSNGDGLAAKLAAFLGEKEFLLGYLTYADLNLAFRVLFMRSFILSLDLEDPFLKYPNLLQHSKRIYEHDVLKGYAESHSYFPCLNAGFVPYYKEHPLP